MPKTKWTINSQGGRDATDLDGCIIETLDGGGYSLSSPHPNSTELSTAPAGTPPVAFEPFLFEGWTWNVSIGLIASSQLSGSWSNDDPSITAESGSWAADVGMDEGTDEDTDEGTDEGAIATAM